MPGKSIWYNKEISTEYSIIVLFDSLIIPDYLKWLRRLCAQSRIILVYANKVANTINPEKISDGLCEQWSSDYADCTRYNLNFASGGGYIRLPLKENKRCLQNDVLFVGRDKNRAHTLFTYKKKLEDIGLSTFFYLVAPRRFLNFRNRFYKPLIPYDDILELIHQSKAILHLVEGGQIGATMRVMESLFHQKKLITDNQLISNCEFYNRNNIFILGKDELGELPEFINKPYIPIKEDILEKYYFDNFIKNIIGN